MARRTQNNETATKETTIVTRMKEEVPIEEVKAENNPPPEQLENNPPEFSPLETETETETDFLPPEQTEIEQIFDLAQLENQNLTAHIYRLPNFELDGRTDSRAQRERVGKLPFSLYLEDAIQQKFGQGIYLVELKTTENRFYARLSNPVIIGNIETKTENQTQLPPQFQTPPLSPFDDKLLHAQDKIFNTMLRLVDKVNQPDEKKSEFELFDKFVQIQKNLQPKEEKDEFVELAKELLKKQILNPAETPQIISDGEQHWSMMFAPAISSVAETLPSLAMAAIEYFNSTAKQAENQSKLEAEKLKAELIRNNQQIELERLRIERLRIEQSLQLEQGQEFIETDNPAVTESPKHAETEQEQPTNDNEQTAMNNQILELLEACKRNDSPEKYAAEIAAAMHDSAMVKLQIKPLLSVKPADLLQFLNQYAPEDLTAIAHAETWLGELQTQIKEKIKNKK